MVVMSILDRYLSVQADDELVVQRGRLLNFIVSVTSAAVVLSMFITIVFGPFVPEYLALDVVALIMFGVLYRYTRRGHRWPPYVFLVFMVLAMPYAFREDLDTPLVLAIAAPVVLAPLITSSWLSIPTAATAAIMLYVFRLVLDYPPPSPLTVVILGFFGVISWLSSWRLENALKESQRNASALGKSNRELQTSRALLESSMRDLQRRSAQLEASAEVGRAATTILEADQLMRQAVELIRERFGLYYVGLFLVEEARSETGQSGEWAVLRAGTGEAGRAMLARSHQIRIGAGMVGWSIAHAQARIASDVGEDAVRLATAELPDTHSEAALPLRSRGQVLGALTVQSEAPAAFDQDTVVVLQTMVDQVAVAIDNARLFAETQAALKESQAVQRRYLTRAWKEFLAMRPLAQIDYTQPGMENGEWRTEAGDERLLREAQRAAMVHERTVATGTDGKATTPQAALVVPLKLRGQVIGTMALHETGHQRAWTADEIALAEAVAEQVTLTVENLRLMDETQRRAVREQTISEAVVRMRETLDMETVLKTAAQEVRQALGLPEVVVCLAPVGQGDPSTSLRVTGHVGQAFQPAISEEPIRGEGQ
jgi:GAF domain-containing protein